MAKFIGENPMGILDRLRKAEKQGVEAARHGMERARDTWEEAESRMRRKMRVHPGSSNGSSSPSMPEPRTPIVSIHGKDVPPGVFKSPAA